MHRAYSLELIADIVNGKLSGPDSAKNITQLLLDSRTVSQPENSLFFAIKGVRNNGHAFIPELINKGVKAFVVNDIPKEFEQKATFIIVGDTLKALQHISAYHRSQYEYDVVGITGSNGKTIVKEWLHQLLQAEHRIVRSPKSYNSQIGVPLSVWQMDSSYDLALFEAGISKPGEMFKLEEIIKPTLGILTNIGNAHDENFKDRHQKFLEKLLLFKDADLLIAPVKCFSSGLAKPEISTFTWSLDDAEADLQAQVLLRSSFSARISITYKNIAFVFEIPFSDEASIENAVTCCCFMLYYGYTPDIIIRRMAVLAPVEMRLEMKAAVNGCTIINDSYNTDPLSLKIALDLMQQQNQHVKKTLILSDLVESGRELQVLYKEVAELVNQQGLFHFVGIGKELERFKSLFSAEYLEFYQDTASFLQQWKASSFNNECILLKGARIFKFESINKRFEEKIHSTVLEVDLNGMVENLNYYRSLLNPGVKTMAMVKATSYGSGNHEVANVLQFHNVDYLAVAYADEGVELRKAGISLPIMVMNPEESTLSVMLQYKLEPEIYSSRLFQRFAEVLSQHRQEHYPIHLKLDTGMHRLGFDEFEIPHLIELLEKHASLVTVMSVFSHMTSSEDPTDDEFSRQQFKKFKAGCDLISKTVKYPYLRHIVNSAGIRRFPEAHFDMVRLGIGLYGISSDPIEQQKLVQISTLRSVVSQIKTVPKGDSIGYNRKAIAEKEMKIATVAIGYADGLNRRLSNKKGSLLIHEKLAPIVGNICMDMCMVDISEIPDVKEGDEAIVFGKERLLGDFARLADTIPYEVLTTISARVKRVYYH